MKNIITVFSFLSLLICCSDEPGADLLVTSKHNAETIGQAMVYVVEGHHIDPHLALGDYTFSQRSDGTGQSYFKGLADGKYTMYVYGYHHNQKVEGRQEFSIISSTRNKTSTIDIYLN